MKAKIKFKIEIEKEFEIENISSLKQYEISQLYKGRIITYSDSMFFTIINNTEIEDEELPSGYVENSFQVKRIEIL